MDRSAPAVEATAGSLESDGPQRTREIGRALGAVAAPGTVVALIGRLGAGKTQLAKGVAEGLGVTSTVNSPTFILMNEHVGRLRLFHVDAYRLDDPAEAADVGILDERLAEGMTVIEWADRLNGWLPDERIDIRIALDARSDRRRHLSWRAHGVEHSRLAAEAFAPR